MKTPTRLAVSITFWTAIALCGGCSRQSGDAHPKRRQDQERAEQPTATLARKYGCTVFAEELEKSVRTNSVYSIDVQRVLAANRRLVASCRLMDVVQSAERVEAVFEIDCLDLGPWSGECLAKLECPTNFISILTSEEILSTWAVVFEITGNRHELKFSKGVDDNDLVRVWSLLVIDGRLTDLGKEP